MDKGFQIIRKTFGYVLLHTISISMHMCEHVCAYSRPQADGDPTFGNLGQILRSPGAGAARVTATLRSLSLLCIGWSHSSSLAVAALTSALRASLAAEAILFRTVAFAICCKNSAILAVVPNFAEIRTHATHVKVHGPHTSFVCCI